MKRIRDAWLSVAILCLSIAACDGKSGGGDSRPAEADSSGLDAARIDGSTPGRDLSTADTGLDTQAPATPAFYVDINNGNDSKPGTKASPWKTLKKANEMLKAGDTVYIMGGEYVGEQIAPDNSGNAAGRITYQNYNDELVVIRDSATPLLLSNRSYVTIKGTEKQNIVIRHCDTYLTMEPGHHNHFINLTIGPDRNYTRFAGGFRIASGSSYNIIRGCTIYGYGDYSGGQDNGDMVYINGRGTPCHHNLVEDNIIYHAGHSPFKDAGYHDVVRNNYFHNEQWSSGYGNRAVQFKDIYGGQAGWSLFEGNRVAFSGIPNDANFSPGVSHHSHDTIVRSNMFYACKGPGFNIESIASSPHVDNNYVYNNVFFYNGIGGVPSNRRNALWLRPNYADINDTVIKNNIFFENSGENIYESPGYGGTGSGVFNTISANNWLAGDPRFVDAVPEKTTDPFDRDYPDFNLVSASPCVDGGAFLTTTTGMGNGTVIAVEDAHYFMDGWGMEDMGVYGDTIQLEGQTQTARVINIDYANNILTIDKPLSWSAGQGLSLKYSGDAPDIGAIERP